jgi:uncharacterized protein (TIGR00255 family)
MKSMTGFGRSEGPVGTGYYSVEIKSVNSRYLDIRYRAPSSLSLFEIPIGETLRKHCERGSFEISVKPKLPSGTATLQSHTRFAVDETALKSLLEAVDRIAQNYKTPKTPTLEFLALTNRVFVPVDDSPESALIWEQFKNVFISSLAELTKMRETEGARLTKVLERELTELSGLTDQIAAAASDYPNQVRAKLEQRIQQWQLSTPMDAQRLEWEVAFYADRATIQEELDRLRSHITEFAEVSKQFHRSVGRRLDFLTQEMHREVNTINSKSSTLPVVRAAIEAKTIIEKLREQVQNVE